MATIVVNDEYWHCACMARDDPKFIVRMPPDLREQVLEASAQSGRSMNSEIVHRLTASFQAASASDALASEVESLRKSSALLLSMADSFGRMMFAAASLSEDDPDRRASMASGEKGIRDLVLRLGKDMGVSTDQVGIGEPDHPLTATLDKGAKSSVTEDERRKTRRRAQ